MIDFSGQMGCFFDLSTVNSCLLISMGSLGISSYCCGWTFNSSFSQSYTSIFYCVPPNTVAKIIPYEMYAYYAYNYLTFYFGAGATSGSACFKTSVSITPPDGTCSQSIFYCIGSNTQMPIGTFNKITNCYSSFSCRYNYSIDVGIAFANLLTCLSAQYSLRGLEGTGATALSSSAYYNDILLTYTKDLGWCANNRSNAPISFGAGFSTDIRLPEHIGNRGGANAILLSCYFIRPGFTMFENSNLGTFGGESSYYMSAGQCIAVGGSLTFGLSMSNFLSISICNPAISPAGSFNYSVYNYPGVAYNYLGKFLVIEEPAS